jgi:hypothetical protein
MRYPLFLVVEYVKHALINLRETVWRTSVDLRNSNNGAMRGVFSTLLCQWFSVESLQIGAQPGIP